MPSLPPNPTLPNVPTDTAQARQWIRQWHETFMRIWTSMVYTLNALCKVDTLANRTATPDLNESFFIASNTLQVFAGVSGAWQNVGPRRGTATVTSGNTSASVTLSPAEPDTNYIVQLTAEDNLGSVWVTSKATSGFTVNCSTAAGVGDDTIAWTLWRTASG